MNNSDSFIMIPASVLDDGRLTESCKMLYGYIVLLSARSGYCFASNAHLASRFGRTARTIARWLTELKELGYIEICEGKNETTGRKQRSIYPRGDDRIVMGDVTEMSIGSGQKCHGRYDKNVMHNNIKYNNINIYKKDYISPTDPRYTLMSPTGDIAQIEQKFMEAYQCEG